MKILNVCILVLKKNVYSVYTEGGGAGLHCLNACRLLRSRVANLYWSSDAIPANEIMPFYAFFCKIENYAVLFHF